MILAVRDRVSGPETVFACDLRVSARVQFAATSGYYYGNYFFLILNFAHLIVLGGRLSQISKCEGHSWARKRWVSL